MLKVAMLKREKVRFILVVLVCLFSVVSFSKVSHARFLQTFLCRVAGPSLSSGEEVLFAKYDIIATKRNFYNDIGGDTWGAVKAINPNTKIYLYQSGITVYDDDDDQSLVYLNTIGRWNVSRAHSSGSINGDNPKLILLDSNGNRINHKGYTNRWNLDFGSADYQNYFIEATLHDLTGQDWEADGIFVDNTMSIGRAGLAAWPAKYPNTATWVLAMNNFVNAVSAGFQSRKHGAFFNRCNSGTIDGFNAWVSLDKRSTPPDAVLEEGAFAVKWGKGDVQFFSEGSWKRQVDLMSRIHNSNVVYLSHSELAEGESGVDNLGKAVTFWDILWYAMGSYHIGKNTLDNNSYFGFSESYAKTTWYDEYDHINLGKAIGNYKVTNYGGNNIYWREFEKGYVFVNPTKYDVSSIVLPETCKQLTHSNFKNNSASLANIKTISMKGHRAAILLKKTIHSIGDPQPPQGLKIIN